jgi:hypothetical protein
MTRDELINELEVWEMVVAAGRGPGMPSNAARDGARKYCRQIEAWFARRCMEDKK